MNKEELDLVALQIVIDRIESGSILMKNDNEYSKGEIEFINKSILSIGRFLEEKKRKIYFKSFFKKYGI